MLYLFICVAYFFVSVQTETNKLNKSDFKNGNCIVKIKTKSKFQDISASPNQCSIIGVQFSHGVYTSIVILSVF